MSKNFLANSSYSLAASSSFSFKASLSYLDISFSMNSFYTFSFISLSRASMSNDSIKSLIYCLDEKEDKASSFAVSVSPRTDKPRKVKITNLNILNNHKKHMKVYICLKVIYKLIKLILFMNINFIHTI